MNRELFLKTAFCCMACDGNIADEEVRIIKEQSKKNDFLNNLDIENLLNVYISSINSEGISFLKSYLNEVRDNNFTNDEKVQLLKIAIDIIEADNEVQYSEIKFFKEIFNRLNVPEDLIEKEFPDKDIYFLPDIAQQDYEFVLNSNFASINLNSAEHV